MAGFDQAPAPCKTAVAPTKSVSPGTPIRHRENDTSLVPNSEKGSAPDRA